MAMFEPFFLVIGLSLDQLVDILVALYYVLNAQILL
jgi:hypothetical protein